MSSCLLANYKRRRSWARDLKPKSYELINRVGYCFKLVAKADLLMVGMLVVGCAAPRGLAQPPLPALNVKRPSQMPLPCPMKTLMDIKNIFEKLLEVTKTYTERKANTGRGVAKLFDNP
jgi:hypothetical protein